MSTSLPTLSSDSTQKESSVRESFSPTSTAYLAALNHVLTHGQAVGPRGKMTLEVEDYHFRVDNPDSRSIVTNDLARNRVIADYTNKELALYFGRSNLASDFAKASTFWKNIANPDGTINSAYGHLIWDEASCGNPVFEADRMGGIVECQEDPLALMKTESAFRRTPWAWAIQSLKQDRDTRQAILKFHRRSHLWFGNRDQVCTMHGLFLIRKNRLNLSIVMRSNDLVKGLVYDLPFFISLMEQMVNELASTYPDLEVGQYRHLSHSMHLYESDIDKVRAMLALRVLPSKDRPVVRK